MPVSNPVAGRYTSSVQSQSATKPGVATAPSTRKRKPHPDLKDRVETFLANANPPRKQPADSQPAKRRRTTNAKSASNAEVVDLTGDIRGTRSTPKKSKNGSPKKETAEKRLRVHRKAPPQSYLKKLERAQTQRMVVLNRKRVDEEAFPCEEIELVGSTGNVYTVTVGLEPKCTCPDHLKGNQCKHIVYALVTVLKAPAQLQYQLAFLSSELREIFAKAPPIPTQVNSADDTSGNQKPVEGECPICYMDFDKDHNQVVWCRAACGNNVHKSCFDQYIASQRGSVVRCVYCRTPWETEGGLNNVVQSGILGADGYVNVAHLTGQSSVRDVSSYHQHWVRRHYYGMGY